MKFVEIYRTQEDGSQRTIATCTLTPHGVICAGEEPFADNLAAEGIPDHSEQGKMLFPSDGIRFLEALEDAFRSGYLMASELQEKDGTPI